jgi:hypothetical protein
LRPDLLLRIQLEQVRGKSEGRIALHLGDRLQGCEAAFGGILGARRRGRFQLLEPGNVTRGPDGVLRRSEPVGGVEGEEAPGEEEDDRERRRSLEQPLPDPPLAGTSRGGGRHPRRDSTP